MNDLLNLADLRERATAGEWQTNGIADLSPNGVFACQPSGNPDVYDPEIFVCSVKPRWDEGCAVGDEAISNANYIAACGNLTPARLRELAAMEAFIREVADDRYDRVSPGVKERARKLLPDGRPGTKPIEESPGDLAVRELRGPFAVMAGAPWNVLDSRGCRIACCGGDSNADRERYGPAIAAAIVAALNADAALATKGPTNE